MFDLDRLGAKMTRLRASILQMSISEVSAQTGISEERIASIEGGAVEPSGDEILILADVYGEPVEYFISNEASASVEKATDLYRMFGGEFAPEDRQGIQVFLCLCRFEHEIESLLGERPRVYNFTPSAPDTFFKRHGRANAEKLRKDLRLGDAPIVNLFQLARTLGAHVFRRRLVNSKISGLMLRHDEFGACILVNFDEDVYRQNFSVAHELCHCLLDTDRTVTVSFERVEPSDEKDREKREWRANAFASHLLLPQAVRDGAPSGVSHDELDTWILGTSDAFKVNPIVVLYALRDANKLTHGEAERAESRLRVPRKVKEDGDLASEPIRIQERRIRHLEAGLSPSYVEMCLRAFREGEISVGRLSDALMVSPLDLSALLLELGHALDLRDVSP